METGEIGTNVSLKDIEFVQELMDDFQWLLKLVLLGDENGDDAYMQAEYLLDKYTKEG